MNLVKKKDMGLIDSGDGDPLPKVTTVRWQIIPDDQPIYFEKKYTPGVASNTLGGTPQDLELPTNVGQLRFGPTASATAGTTIGGSGRTTFGQNEAGAAEEVPTGGGIAR